MGDSPFERESALGDEIRFPNQYTVLDFLFILPDIL